LGGKGAFGDFDAMSVGDPKKDFQPHWRRRSRREGGSKTSVQHSGLAKAFFERQSQTEGFPPLSAP
jgi:aminoglycoside phosphotransferase (APT) family kinase protein